MAWTRRPFLVVAMVVAAFTALAVVPATAAAAPAASADLRHAAPAPTPGIAPSAGTGGAVHANAFANPGVLAYGDAPALQAPTGVALSAPVVGMAATPDGGGYWLVAADGGVFTLGDAHFYGSAGSVNLYAPVVGMAATPDGGGYWLVAADGGIFTFGDAPFHGSQAGNVESPSFAGMAATANDGGYWLVATDGSVHAEGDATWYGDHAPGAGEPAAPVAAIAAANDGGYWLLEPDAFRTAFTHPGGGGAIVASAASQVQADPDSGPFCNPYGPCEEWCALFATWVWESAGVPIPRYAFTGDIYTWAATYTAVRAPTSRPAPGWAVLYGTGPWTVETSVHVGVVAQVWPDGAVTTIEGDAGPGPWGRYSVVINGPYLPSHSSTYNGVGIYAYAVP